MLTMLTMLTMPNDELKLKLIGIYVDKKHLQYMDENILKHSELIRYLIDNYEPYKQWRIIDGRKG